MNFYNNFYNNNFAKFVLQIIRIYKLASQNTSLLCQLNMKTSKLLCAVDTGFLNTQLRFYARYNFLFLSRRHQKEIIAFISQSQTQNTTFTHRQTQLQARREVSAPQIKRLHVRESLETCKCWTLLGATSCDCWDVWAHLTPFYLRLTCQSSQ